MNSNSVINTLVDKVNTFRSQQNLKEIDLFEKNKEFLKYVNFQDFNLDLNLEEDKISDAVINDTIDKLFSSSDEKNLKKKQILLEKFATGIRVEIDFPDELVTLKVYVYDLYVELEEVGPVIDGDLVIQGLVLDVAYGPAYCVIEHSLDVKNEFKEITVIGPWKMMITPPNEENNNLTRFIVPISIDSPYHKGFVKVKLYIDNINKIPYDEEEVSTDINNSKKYDMNSKQSRDNLILATTFVIESIRGSTDEAQENQGNFTPQGKKINKSRTRRSRGIRIYEKFKR